MKKCIFADNSSVVNRVASKMLKKNGFEVYVAENGVDVLDIWKKEEDINVIFVEYTLSGLSGIDVLYKIISESPDNRPYIIMLLTGENEYHIKTSLDSGADDCIIKPFDEEIIKSKLSIIGII